MPSFDSPAMLDFEGTKIPGSRIPNFLCNFS